MKFLTIYIRLICVWIFLPAHGFSQTTNGDAFINQGEDGNVTMEKVRKLEELQEINGSQVEGNSIIELLRIKSPDVRARVYSLISFFSSEGRFSINDARIVFESIRPSINDGLISSVSKDIDAGNEPSVWCFLKQFIAFDCLCRYYPVISGNEYEGFVQGEFLSKSIRVFSVRRYLLSARCELGLVGLVTESTTADSCVQWLDTFIESVVRSGRDQESEPRELCDTLINLWQKHPLLGAGKPMNYILINKLEPKIKEYGSIIKMWETVGRESSDEDKGYKDQALVIIGKVNASISK